MRVIFCVILLALFWSCENDNTVRDEIDKIDIDLTIERFDIEFAKTTPETFAELKGGYPFLFSKQVSDSIYITRLNDSLQLIINSEIEKAFPFNNHFGDIELLLKHLKYYDKTFTTPRVVTVSNKVDYRNKVIVTDTIVLIALDNYLSKEHEFYANISKYIRQNFEPEQIVVDLAEAYSKNSVYQVNRKTLLDDMIYAGKVLYFKDIMIPFKTDFEKIGYNKQQLDWAEENETNIWSYMVENELLFSTDPKLASRFINPAPFTKFGLSFDNESPGRLGQYIGWQIVRAYMKNNDVSFEQMLINDPGEIFSNSKFKPRK